jgi:hypothetical protein
MPIDEEEPGRKARWLKRLPYLAIVAVVLFVGLGTVHATIMNDPLTGGDGVSCGTVVRPAKFPGYSFDKTQAENAYDSLEAEACGHARNEVRDITIAVAIIACFVLAAFRQAQRELDARAKQAQQAQGKHHRERAGPDLTV